MNVEEAKPDDKAGMIPVYWAENINEYAMLFRQVQPQILTKNAVAFETIINFMLTLIGNREWMPNPHVRAKYLQFLGNLIPPKHVQPNAKDENFGFVFKNNPFVDKFLVKYLVRMFIDVEKTGSHNQFFEKFSYRFGFCNIINHLFRKENKSEGQSKYALDFERTSQEDFDTFFVVYKFRVE